MKSFQHHKSILLLLTWLGSCFAFIGHAAGDDKVFLIDNLSSDLNLTTQKIRFIKTEPADLQPRKISSVKWISNEVPTLRIGIKNASETRFPFQTPVNLSKYYFGSADRPPLAIEKVIRGKSNTSYESFLNGVVPSCTGIYHHPPTLLTSGDVVTYFEANCRDLNNGNYYWIVVTELKLGGQIYASKTVLHFGSTATFTNVDTYTQTGCQTGDWVSYVRLTVGSSPDPDDSGATFIYANSLLTPISSCSSPSPPPPPSPPPNWG